ncbi:MAG TPA: cytochrome c-type biogenesis CcmF C-terminal domain-containing protein, partial [Anaerolineaceae bacterium]|nr:cytochrome c-type biogenesis CcmF C-terminal domain-containing protein [Anaerolineaceae bacterium]
GARWSVVPRRIAENYGAFTPWIALLFIPIAVFAKDILPWMNIEGIKNPEYKTVTAETVLYKDGKEIARLNPAQHIYPDRQQYITIPDAHATLRGDVYTLLAGYDVDIPYITLRLSDNPLVNFMWVGGVFMTIGGALAATLPARRGEREDETETMEETLDSSGAADF